MIHNVCMQMTDAAWGELLQNCCRVKHCSIMTALTADDARAGENNMSFLTNKNPD